MRSAFENGRPITAAVDIFAYSPALALSLNAEAASAGRRALVPGSAPYAAKAAGTNPPLSRIVCARFMIVDVLPGPRLRRPLGARRPLSPNCRRFRTRRLRLPRHGVADGERCASNAWALRYGDH